MLLALNILLSAIVIILLLLLGCLLIPLAYEFNLLGTKTAVQFHFGLHNCCLGLSACRDHGNLYWCLHILGKPIALKPKSTPPKSSTEPSRDRSGSTSSRSLLYTAISDSNLQEQGLKLIISLWQKIKPRHVTINVRIGFSEPHYTGWMMALAAIIQRDNQSYTIHIEGVWDEACLEGELALAGKVIPGMVLWNISKFLLHPEIRPYFRKLREKTAYSRKQAA